jgi:hypothetical protein
VKEILVSPSKEEHESFTFTPDPDFLKKINQNMLKNDRNFNGMG